MYHGERLNSVTHLLGLALAVVGSAVLVSQAVHSGDPLKILSFSVFGLTMIVLYAASSLYHSIRGASKALWAKVDHCAIYLLIAGTYTPYMMVSLGDGNGPLMLLGVWSLALIGFLLDIFIKTRIQTLQIFIYLLMGWICVLEFDHLQEAIAAPGIVMLVIGGIAYTLGVIFYVLDHQKKFSYAHGIWHIFVLVGSVSHFISIIGFVR